MDKETRVILGWVGIDPDEFDLDEFYRSPKLWITLIVVCLIVGSLIALT